MEQSNVVCFHNAYINADEKELDRLWKEVAPQRLIKFFPAKYADDGTNRFLKHLTTKKLCLSSPVVFNDPFDSVINFDYRTRADQISKELLVNLVGERIAQEIMGMNGAQEKIEKAIDSFHSTMGHIDKQTEQSIYTTCFSEKDNLYSLRMWGHYANSHTGVCAEYTFYDVNQSSPFGCIPIKYTDDYEYLINPKNKAEDVFNFLKLYTKAAEWQYEKEWRVSQKRENYDGLRFEVDFVQPCKIYLGCKADERLKKDIMQLCENQEIEVYQMKMRPGSFFLDVESVN